MFIPLPLAVVMVFLSGITLGGFAYWLFHRPY